REDALGGPDGGGPGSRPRDRGVAQADRRRQGRRDRPASAALPRPGPREPGRPRGRSRSADRRSDGGDAPHSVVVRPRGNGSHRGEEPGIGPRRVGRSHARDPPGVRGLPHRRFDTSRRPLAAAPAGALSWEEEDVRCGGSDTAAGRPSVEGRRPRRLPPGTPPAAPVRRGPTVISGTRRRPSLRVVALAGTLLVLVAAATALLSIRRKVE